MNRGCPTALLSLLGVAAQGAVAQSLPNVGACISRLDAQVDIGYDRIAARCPDLVRQIEQGSWSAWLPRGWKEPGNDLSAGGLKELRELAGSEITAPTPAHTLDVGKLNRVLAELGHPGATDESGWSRFKAWLRSILEPREPAPADNWFTKMVSHVGFTQSLLEVLSYAALAAVVVLAGIIVLNELRNAGLLRKPPPGARKRRGTPARVPDVEGGWSDIAGASSLDKPRLLLKLIVARLSGLGLLPPSGALTVRELARAARLGDAEDRSRLTDLAVAAERVRFSAREVPVASLEASVSRGHELLVRLDAGAAPGAGVHS
jgi:hypothetical protein